MQQNNPYLVEAVDRALVLLSLLAERGQLSVTEAGQELGVAPSTAHRLLATLCHRDFAVQGDKRRYRPGPGLLRAKPRGIPTLPDRLRPYLEELYGTVGETVHLMTRIGAEVLFVDGIEGTQSLRVGLRTGLRMPAHRTSGGKAMLADLNPAEVEELHVTAPTRSGIEDPAPSTLRRELDAVRRNHFGFNHDESEPGVTAVGASLGVVGEQPAAFAVALPTARMETVGMDALADELVRVCRRVREEVGDAAR